MFPAYRTGREKQGLAAEMLHTLRNAGCDTTSKRDLEMGMVAYNVALLACRQRHPNERAVRSAEKWRAGRNEPCPCGSGRKYKKCCLDKDRAPPADSLSVAPFEFGPETLPRLWDDRAVAEDLEILSRIIERDPAFAQFGFSTEKIDSFMDMVVREDPSFMKRNGDDEDENNRTIDDLAFRYVRESGEILKGAKEKFLGAATRAQSKDEIRALATGMFLELASDSSDDPECNLLNAIFFRRAIADMIRQTALADKIIDRLGGDLEEIRRLRTANDPSAHQKIEECLKSLTASEMEAVEASFEKDRKALWDTISAGEFPVPMPFATQLALAGQFESLTGKEKRSPEELYEIVEAFSDELIEEDYILYSKMLDQWSKNSENQSRHVARAVQMMTGLCETRSIGHFVPALLVRCGRVGLVLAFNEEEQRFVDNCPKSLDDPEFFAEYAAWLTANGYPGMANRLRTSWEKPRQQQVA